MLTFVQITNPRKWLDFDRNEQIRIGGIENNMYKQIYKYTGIQKDLTDTYRQVRCTEIYICQSRLLVQAFKTKIEEIYSQRRQAS